METRIFILIATLVLFFAELAFIFIKAGKKSPFSVGDLIALFVFDTTITIALVAGIIGCSMSIYTYCVLTGTLIIAVLCILKWLYYDFFDIKIIKFDDKK